MFNIWNRKKLINTNLYNINTEKKILIQFLDDFSYFDKRISIKEFITDKINNTIFYNTNIFTLIKFIDNEYDKLDKGIYCENCYKIEKDCICSNKNKYNSNYYSNGSSDDNLFDLDLNGDSESKSNITINYFIDENDRNSIVKDNKNLNKNNDIILIKKIPKKNNDENNKSFTIILNNN